jgi:putative ABC transport system permease protein
VAVVNEAMARRFWGDANSVGRRFRIGSPQRPWVSVVGVVGDARHNGIASVVKAKFYRPHAQFHRSSGGATRDMAVVLKTDGDPLALAAGLRSVVRAIDPEVPVSRMRTMAEVVGTGFFISPRYRFVKAPHDRSPEMRRACLTRLSDGARSGSQRS